MASGLPVLAPDAGGPRDERFAGGLRSTVALLADRGLRGRIGAAARDPVRARTWPAVCDELLGHYDQVSGALLAA